MNELTSCAKPDYEAMYEQAQAELEKAKCEISYLRDENRDLHLCKERYDMMLNTLEFVFGRSFYNG